MPGDTFTGLGILLAIGFVLSRARTNPAPADASRDEIREEWRAHKAVSRAIRAGRLTRPFPAMQAHHPDYSRVLDIEWETASAHKGLSHKY